MNTSTPNPENQPESSSAIAWYYVMEEERLGPVSEQSLIAMIKSGGLDKKTMIWKDGLPEWVLLDNTGFAKFLPRSDSPPLDQAKKAIPREEKEPNFFGVHFRFVAENATPGEEKQPGQGSQKSFVYENQGLAQSGAQSQPVATNQCVRCKSGNVTAGDIGRSTRYGWRTAVFKPDREVRFLGWILSKGTDCDRETFACLDCGLVWSSLYAQDLREFIRINCK